MPGERLYVSPAEAARIIGCSRPTIYLWIQRGLLDARRVGGLILIPVAAVRSLGEEASVGEG
jgi:excisionase family DNA binding protein